MGSLKRTAHRELMRDVQNSWTVSDHWSSSFTATGAFTNDDGKTVHIKRDELIFYTHLYLKPRCITIVYTVPGFLKR